VGISIKHRKVRTVFEHMRKKLSSARCLMRTSEAKFEFSRCSTA